jgi:hypothetical protein
MPLARIRDVGKIGVIKDLSSHDLPPNAWTDASNVRFLDGMAQQFLGHQAVYAPPSVTPYHVLPVTISSVVYWLYAGAQKIYSVTSPSVHTNITRQTVGVDVNYTGLRNAWTSTVLGGVPIINSGSDAPQQWLLSGKCTDLANWPANTTCAVMRSFKNSLIALDVTKTGTRYPYMVKWSHPADPGTVPSTWDVSDVTKDAGELEISDGYDEIIDGMALRDYFVIYKRNSVHRLDYIGGIFIYKEGKVLGMSGAMNRNCIAEIDGQHFVLTNEDVVVHDGFQAQSVLDKQTRRSLFSMIDGSNFVYSFVVKNPYYNEMWVCYPESGQSVPNKAMVWNWVDKTVSFRDLPSANHAAVGRVVTTATSTWAGDSGSWDSDTTLWSNDDSTLSVSRVLMATNDTNFFLLDESTTFDGTSITSYVERRGLSFDQPENMKLVRGIRPRIKGTDGQTVLVYVGAANSPYDDPTYQSAVTYTIGTTVQCSVFCSGRYIAIKFASGTAQSWRIDSYEVDVQLRGSW